MQRVAKAKSVATSVALAAAMWSWNLPVMVCVRRIDDFSWIVRDRAWCIYKSTQKSSTLPKTIIAPENGPSQKETSIPNIHFQMAFAVSFREGNKV